ncbi:hypothetical protein VSS74_18115 [Conexibacter stalactiti]|uniref:Uncharacterized protein n=1 Tax=Conexibacter stalactiti TaxID=1940611 RepID=A0ABU4HUQ2_9ACTN|nr:hypothetical protein [Conexibacter stalactiti]MDW5596270.1 hypothetical protein [Conexibacter stalactiti]MEC5036912.1 hypothetical protein [Conexibacter stalactiti]
MAQSARADDFSDDETESITGLAAAEKVVISSTLKSPYAWPNTTVLSGDVVDLVRELVESRTFDDRSQLLEYVPRLLDAPLGR